MSSKNMSMFKIKDLSLIILLAKFTNNHNNYVLNDIEKGNIAQFPSSLHKIAIISYAL